MKNKKKKENKKYFFFITVIIIICLGGILMSKGNTKIQELFEDKQKRVILPQGEEIISEYTPSSFTTCRDGSCTTDYSIGRKYYYEDEVWKEINTSFYYNGTHYIADGNNFKVYVKDNLVVIKGENESEVYFRIPTTNPPLVSENTVSYDISTQGAVKMTAILTLTVTSEGVEKLITISSIKTNSGTIKYTEELSEELSKSKFIIGDLVIWYTSCSGEGDEISCENIYYPQNWIKSGNSIELELNKSWFDSVVYPIYIDPAIYYNFTDYSVHRAYGQSADTGTVSSAVSDQGTVPPTFTDAWGTDSKNFTAGGYTALSSSDNSYANIISDGNNEEPLGVFNFTVSEALEDIIFVNVTMEQHWVTADTNCYYYIANHTSGVFEEFGASIGTSTDTTRTKSFSGDSLVNILNGANRVSMATAVQADKDDGCAVDYVGITVDYETYVPVLTSQDVNDSEVFIGDSVNHSVVLTKYPTHYIFSWNASGAGCDTWVNSSDFYINGDGTAYNVSVIPSECADKAIGYRFYANNSVGWNVSDVSVYDVNSYGTLNVNLTTPLNGASVTRYSIFDFNTTLTCLGGAKAKCGLVNIFSRYNYTGTTPDTDVNTTEGDIPFYIEGGEANENPVYWRPINFSNPDNACLYPQSGFDYRYNDSRTSCAYNAGGDVVYYYDLSPNITKGILFSTHYINVNNALNLRIYNFSSGSWYLWKYLQSVPGTYSIKISKENGLISDNNQVIQNVSFRVGASVKIYDTYIQTIGGSTYSYWGITNPSSLSNATFYNNSADYPCTNSICGNEFNDTNYQGINQSDLNFVILGGNDYYKEIQYHFKINESINSINSLYVYYFGYATSFASDIHPIIEYWNGSSWVDAEDIIFDTSSSNNRIAYFIISDKEIINNMVDSNNFVHIKSRGGGPDKLYDNYISLNVISSGMSNPITTSSLNYGDSYYANWTINATGTDNTLWSLGAFFNSSYGNPFVADNHTSNSTVCIGTCGAGGESTSFTVQIAEGYTEINFTANNKSVEYLTPTGQTSETPIIIITNTGDVSLGIYIKMNATEEGFVLMGSKTNDYLNSQIINTTDYIINESISPSQSQNMWMFLNWTDKTPQTIQRLLNVSVQE